MLTVCCVLLFLMSARIHEIGWVSAAHTHIVVLLKVYRMYRKHNILFKIKSDI